jgi:hypothetical protein
VLDVVGEVDHPVEGERVAHHHAVSDRDTLGVAGGAGGVDDGEDVVGARLLPALFEGVGAVEPASGGVQ